MTLAIKVFGVEECLATFAALPMDIQNRKMRIAMNAGGGVIRDAAVALAPSETGLLKKSLKVKATVPNASHNPAHHGKPAKAIIGASRNVVGVQTFRKSGAMGKVKTARLKKRKKGEADRWARSGLLLGTTVRRPSRYAHLVEKGTKRGVKGQHFLSRAVSVAGAAAQSKVIAKLQEGLHEFAASRRSRHSFAMGA